MRTHIHIYIPFMGSSPLPAKSCYKMTGQFSVANLYATNLQYRWHLQLRVFNHLLNSGTSKLIKFLLVPLLSITLALNVINNISKFINYNFFFQKNKRNFCLAYKTNIYFSSFNKMHDKCEKKMKVKKRTFGPSYITDTR